MNALFGAPIHQDLALGFAVTLISTLVLVPLVSRYAIQAGLYDAPGHRKIHQYPVPRLGGVAIFASFIIGLGVVGAFGHSPTVFLLGKGNLGLLAGGTLIFLLGLLDDLVNLSPYVKLSGQFIAALVAFGMGVNIDALDLPGSLLLVLNVFSLPVTLMWLVGISNAVNFIDGLDGLAGGVGMFAAMTLAVVAIFTGQPQVAMLSLLLCASCLGFLVYNTHPARIFMGDSGALFIGFTLACLSILGVLKTYTVVMLAPILVLCIPVLDITYSTLRRLVAGRNPFIADGDHLHHRLMKAGFSQPKTVGVFYALSVISGLGVSFYVHSLPLYLVLLLGIVCLGSGLVLFVRNMPQQGVENAPSPRDVQGQDV
jgi:UDP-GlcNAc:undecaprenyl-phosphate/decaprenyl-phosphate GlcNAc-1-phosphate transferase